MAAQAIDIMVPARYWVDRVKKETQDTLTLDIEPSGGADRHPFEPGQFSMLYTFGVGELPISISGDPQEPRRLTYTIRSVGPATRALVNCRAGDSIGVRGPFGKPWPVAAARGHDLLIVAGGIGLAPLRPVIYHALRRRDEFGRIVIMYGARSPRDLLFRKELQQWAKARDTQVLSTVDYGGVDWRGNVGVVTNLFRFARLHPDRTVAMTCGPEIMMRFAIHEMIARGLREDAVYLSMERNMKCAVGFCGHCQWGSQFICKDGPVFAYEDVRERLDRYEL